MRYAQWQMYDKSPGVDGLPMDFLKHAIRTAEVDGETVKTNIFAAPLAIVLTKMLASGAYPREWSVGAVAPVPKPKGDPGSKDDHRAIVVGQAMAKLFSLVMLRRMDAWAEDEGMRAAGQAGFRHGRGTPDNAFVLQHVIEKYRSLKKPVYAAFIDFRKAYDSVSRPLLWECLRGLGVHGRALSVLQSMYSDVRLRVRLEGVLGEMFSSGVGVMQGCPLSPLFFGLLIDRIEAFMHEMLPGVGVHLGQMLLQILLYADDLVLLAESQADLQKMLDALQQFCELMGLTVNVKKSEAVIFNNNYAPRGAGVTLAGEGGPSTLVYNGAPLAVKSMFVYVPWYVV